MDPASEEASTKLPNPLYNFKTLKLTSHKSPPFLSRKNLKNKTISKFLEKKKRVKKDA